MRAAAWYVFFGVFGALAHGALLWPWPVSLGVRVGAWLFLSALAVCAFARALMVQFGREASLSKAVARQMGTAVRNLGSLFRGGV